MVQPETQKSFSLGKKICFSFVIVLILFTLLETGLRASGFSFQPQYSIYAENAWGAHGVEQDPTLPWSWTPTPGALCHIDGRVDFHFNELGYRGPVFQKEKPSGVLRIICMGDSGTLGWGVKDGEMYCADLQQVLENRCNKNVEMINAGVFGFTSYQGLHQLKNKVLELKPDIITICYNWNDHADAIKIAQMSGKYAWEKGVPTSDKNLYHPQRYAGLYRLLSRLRIYQLLQSSALKIAETSGPKNQNQIQPEKPLLRVSPDDFRNNLDQIVELARANQIKPILLTQAFNPKRFDKPEMAVHVQRQRQYNEIVRQVSAKLNVPLVDPTTILETDPKFFNSNTHPTRSGHHKIAQLVANTICSLEQ